MKKAILISLVAIFTLSFGDAYGQSVTRILKKKQDKEEEKIERKIEGALIEGIGKKLGKKFGKEEETTDSTAVTTTTEDPDVDYDSDSDSSPSMDMNALMGSMGITTGTTKVKEKYEFDAFIEMTINNYNKKGKLDETVIYKNYVSEKSLDYRMEFKDPDEEGQMNMIFDTENYQLLTLAEEDGEKTGFAMKLNPADVESMSADMEEDTEEDVDAYAMYKTGKTKNILGYKCHEYRIEENEDQDVITLWITKELNKKMNKSYMKNSTFAGTMSYAYNADGTVLEYIFEDGDNGEKTVMTVTDIDLNKKSSFSTQGYQIMTMNVDIPDEQEDD